MGAHTGKKAATVKAYFDAAIHQARPARSRAVRASVP